jgi:SAM-dependent methyltransferase
MYRYDNSFFAVVDETAAASAKGLIGALVAQLPVTSVLDVGCGRGVWLEQWLQHGATEVMGVDGPYVDVKLLHVAEPCFLARDISQSFSLGRRFDLVQSLEVAEHLTEASADIFIDNLVRHASIVLFSAAIPGQGGEHHVNEQPLEYWRTKFAARDFAAFDFVRPRIRGDQTISFYYRFNTILYVHTSLIAGLPASIRASYVYPGKPLIDDMPLALRLRLCALKHVPRPVIDQAARLKYQFIAWSHAVRQQRPVTR